jgi:hypothetical protein
VWREYLATRCSLLFCLYSEIEQKPFPPSSDLIAATTNKSSEAKKLMMVVIKVVVVATKKTCKLMPPSYLQHQQQQLLAIVTLPFIPLIMIGNGSIIISLQQKGGIITTAHQPVVIPSWVGLLVVLMEELLIMTS